jgi:hypothetical protein
MECGGWVASLVVDFGARYKVLAYVYYLYNKAFTFAAYVEDGGVA